jgi:hypothetical protein
MASDRPVTEKATAAPSVVARRRRPPRADEVDTVDQLPLNVAAAEPSA